MFDEGMKPALGGELVRGKAAEFPEVRDHVRLVGIAGFERRLSPIDIVTWRRQTLGSRRSVRHEI